MNLSARDPRYGSKSRMFASRKRKKPGKARRKQKKKETADDNNVCLEIRRLEKALAKKFNSVYVIYVMHKRANGMGNKSRKRKPKKRNLKLRIRQMIENRRQKSILQKLNPPPKPKLEDEPEDEPEVHSAPRPAQSVEVSFPSNPKPASAWARRVTRANGQQFWPRMTSRVCCLHFPPHQLTTDARGLPALEKGAVPTALPSNQEELQNIEQVSLPKSDTKFGPIEYSEDLLMKIEMDDESPEVKQAVASLVDIPPPENGIKLQCVNAENKNATVHYLSVDKDYTVNHTHVNINKNNIATLHYVDTKNTVKHTSKCINLNENQINPNITQTPVMKIEIVPNQNDRENGYGIKINSKLVGENNMTPDEDIDETVQDTLTDNLDADIRVKSEYCNDDEEIEEVILGAADTSEIQTCDNDYEETVVVKMEYESDSDNDSEPKT